MGKLHKIRRVIKNASIEDIDRFKRKYSWYGIKIENGKLIRICNKNSYHGYITKLVKNMVT